MNLINDPWIPVRRKSSKHEPIAPWQLTETDDPIVALDALRPDFNGALMQFLIGLLQTAATPANHDKWLDWLEEPPTPEKLKECFSQYADVFELHGDNGSFMQDFDSLENGTVNKISRLLIDSPGVETVNNNTDHFVKRDRVEQLCSCCAAAALFTLQINAPGGGRGNMTSLRGGGPLTTLVMLDENSDLPIDLWRNLWINVLDRPYVKTLTGNAQKTRPCHIFPWMSETRISERKIGQVTTPMDMHPFHMYWSMSRRVRLLQSPGDIGRCDLCEKESVNLFAQYVTREC